MRIEFLCSQCQRTLRVPHGSEGKKTKCPKCDAVQRIPGGAADEPGLGAPSGDSPSQGDDPLWDDLSSGSARPLPGPEGQGDYGQSSHSFGETAPNPYASPAATTAGVGMASQATGKRAKTRLMGPAIATMIVAGIAWAFNTWVLVFYMTTGMEELRPPGRPPDPQEELLMFWSFVAGAIMITIVTAVIFFAMSRALQVRNYGFVFAGFILAIVPCISSYYCILALPFSIWGIVVLLDDSVKAAFRSP